MQALLLAALLFLPSPAATSPGDDLLARSLDAIDPRAIKADIYFLASDELMGRDTPSDGLKLAARYVRARLMRHGFTPAGDHGFFDEYDLEQKRLDPERTSLVLAAHGRDADLEYGDDYVFPDRDVAELAVEGPLVYVGTGAAADLAGLDGHGAWAVAVDSDLPWRERLAAIKATGALGLVVVQSAEEGAELETRHHANWAFQARAGSVSLAGAPAGEPVFPQVYVNRAPFAELLGAAPKPGARLAGSLRHARAVAEGRERFTVENVCGLWPGSDPALKDEVLILSAHYDHVGMQGGEIHNGADDNASGSTGLLSVADALAVHGPLRRSVLLLWVSGEEKGLLGSQAWSLDPTLPEGYRAVADINIDMIGRNAPDSLLITPTKKLPQYNELVRMAEANAPLEGFPVLGSCDEYWARSDQKSFSDNLGIPVMFLFSDVHEDYHQPTDDPEKVDCDKVRRVSRLVVRMLADLQGDKLF